MIASPRVAYSFDLVSHLVAREFRLRYRNALLGWTWAIAEPLSRFVVLAFVFTKIVPLNIPNYPVFLFSGLMAWTWFSAGILSGTSSAEDRRDLLYRPGIPPIILPIVSILTDGIDYVASLPVLLVFLLVGPGIPPTVVALPFLLLIQLMLMIGVGSALCAANVFLRDVRVMVSVGLTILFYVTPVFYNADRIPEKYRFLVSLNPMARLIVAYRNVLIEGHLPKFEPMLLLVATSAAVLIGGCLIYNHFSGEFVDEL